MEFACWCIYKYVNNTLPPMSTMDEKVASNGHAVGISPPPHDDPDRAGKRDIKARWHKLGRQVIRIAIVKVAFHNELVIFLDFVGKLVRDLFA